MHRHAFARYIVPAILALVVGTPFFVRQLTGRHRPITTVDDTPLRLIIMTPHGDQIRNAFAHAYNASRRADGAREVHLDFRTMGGTSDLRKQVFSQFTALARRGREDDGIGVDIFFGGGPYEHDKLAHGITMQRNGEDVTFSVSMPIDMTTKALTAVFPEATIGGEPLFRRDRVTGRPLWVGTALSSFGIVANRDLLAMLDLPEPRTWSDLGDPRYANWVAMADPGHSGSVAATCNTVLQRKGWHHGWAILRRVFANARYFSSSATKVPLDVSAGEAAAGMCIDFYGRYQASAMPDQRIVYVDPRESRTDNAPLATAVTADPISVLRGAPSPELAHNFVRWVLSAEAQRLWQRRPGTEGGPVQHALRRIPVRRDLFTAREMAHWIDRSNPFLSAKPLPPGIPSFYRLVAPLSHAIAIDIHNDLRAAWQAIDAHPHDACRHAMLALFDAMPGAENDHGLTIPWPDDMAPQVVSVVLAHPDDARYDKVIEAIRAFAGRAKQRYTTPGSTHSWNDSAKLRRDRLAWMRFFRANYRRIIDLANNPSTCPATASASASKSYPPSRVETSRPAQWRSAAAAN